MTDQYRQLVAFEQNHVATQCYILTLADESKKQGIWLRLIGLYETWDIARN